ncbi:MAG: HigA family addiction module antitoxin [Prevotella sp.]|nr:HigA family addiction module antitoxin [Prevotella sp.]
MATRSDRLVPARAIHPGEILREELRERGIKQKDFAQLIGMQPSHLNAFIKGKRNLNEDLAIKLEKHLGLSYRFWMDFYNAYVYDCKAIEERDKEKQAAMEYENACAEIINLKYLYKRLDMAVLSCAERVKRLKELFDFDLLSSNALRLQVAGMYKHSEKVQADDRNMNTWLVLNWLETSRSKVENEYVEGNALKAAKEISQMANNQLMKISAVKECLNHYGIAYIELKKLDKAPIDAYSTKSNGHPCITVTYRYNDKDKLAFDILHELCHIEKHFSDDHKDFITIDKNEYSNDPLEKEANIFARQMLIPDDVWKNIMNVNCRSLNPSSIVKSIATQAKKYGISPSIAISRYKHDTGWYGTTYCKSPKISSGK